MLNLNSILNGIFGALEPALPKISVPPQYPNKSCCEKNDQKTLRPCNLCRAQTCNYCHGLLNGQWICKECRDRMKADLEAEKAENHHVPRALAGGLVAALSGAGLWSTLVILSGAISMFFAIGVGIMAGFGVLWGSGRKRGASLQWVAVACSIMGIILGHYVIAIYFLKLNMMQTNPARSEAISYLDPKMLGYFFSNIAYFCNPLSILFSLPALTVAWIIPKPRSVAIR